MLAELAAIEVDQGAAVLVLLGRHLREHLRGGRVAVLEAIGIIGVDAAVLLLQRDSQSEDLSFSELSK
jgi:hypothetical protein